MAKLTAAGRTAQRKVFVEFNAWMRELFERRLSKQGLNEVQREILGKGSALAERLMKLRARGGVFKRPTGRYLNSISSAIIGQATVAVSPLVIYARWLEEGGLHPRWKVPTAFRGYQIVAGAYQEFEPKMESLAEQIIRKHIGAA